MRLEFTPDVETRTLSGARRWVAKRDSPEARTVLLPMIVHIELVHIHRMSFVRIGMGFVAAINTLVNWFVKRTVTLKIVSSLRWMIANWFVITFVFAVTTRLVTLIIPV